MVSDLLTSSEEHLGYVLLPPYRGILLKTNSNHKNLIHVTMGTVSSVLREINSKDKFPYPKMNPFSLRKSFSSSIPSFLR